MTENNKTLFHTDFIIEDEIIDKDNNEVLLTTTFYNEVDETTLSPEELDSYKKIDDEVTKTKANKLIDYHKSGESSFSRDDSDTIITVFESESWIKNN